MSREFTITIKGSGVACSTRIRAYVMPIYGPERWVEVDLDALRERCPDETHEALLRLEAR